MKQQTNIKKIKIGMRKEVNDKEKYFFREEKTRKSLGKVES